MSARRLRAIAARPRRASRGSHRRQPQPEGDRGNARSCTSWIPMIRAASSSSPREPRPRRRRPLISRCQPAASPRVAPRAQHHASVAAPSTPAPRRKSSHRRDARSSRAVSSRLRPNQEHNTATRRTRGGRRGGRLRAACEEFRAGHPIRRGAAGGRALLGGRLNSSSGGAEARADTRRRHAASLRSRTFRVSDHVSEAPAVPIERFHSDSS